MISNTKLMEYKYIQILIFTWICFISCSFGDVIISRCKKECQNQVTDVEDKDLFCNKECKLNQCNSGCESYMTAVNSSCQIVCSDSYNRDGTSSTRQQTERQYCTQGCSYALEVFTDNIKNLLGDVQAPELKKDTKGFSSLTLHWNVPIISNVTYFIQSRILDTNGDWLIYSTSSVQPNGDIYITGLQPYITYKFRISLVISTSEVLYTPESENITTLPHGVPSSAPTITEISAPTSSVISLSWIPPMYTNGPLLCYRLNLEPLNNKKLHETSIEVPSNVTSWTFRQLMSSQEYLVTISAWNQAGEGLLDTANMTTPSSGNLSKEEIPYLILAEDNKVILQDMTDVVVKGPDTVLSRNSQNNLIKGIAVHIQKQIILCSDSEGRVHRVAMATKMVTEDVYPSISHPGAMTIDWLHNYTYIVDGLLIKRCDLDRPTCIMATGMLPSQPNVIQVDPINGFLFFTQGSNNMGLYAIDIGEITPSGPANYFLLVNFQVNAFSIDFNNMQLYFPNDTLNTIMSSFLDGSSIADVRKDTVVVRRNYHQITSLISSNGIFYFTDGSKVVFEEYNEEKFYLNQMLLFGTHYSSLNVYQQTAQPHPVPHSPPQNVRALFTDQRVLIQWNRPKTLSYQGKGAYQSWFYEISLFEDDGTENEILEKVTGAFLEVENLVPNTTYQVKIRAWSKTGSGPWSEVFVGRTLSLEASTAKVIVAATQSDFKGVLYEIDMNGQHVKDLTNLSFWNRHLIDLTWADDKIFWASSFNKVYMYDRTTSRQSELAHISDATSVAYDWLGQKLYWSNPVHNVIRRSDLDGKNKEFVIQGKARHMAIDGLQGRLYWVTMNTMEAAYLNGDDHIVYFSVPYFCGKHVISLTLNFDLRKVLWYVKSFERQELFMSDLLGNGITEDQLSVQPLGSFISVSPFSVMQYFSHRLFWQNEKGSIVVGDLECNFTSEITVEPVSVFTVTHPSLHPYPEGTDKSNLQIIPAVIPESSIRCEGHWSLFNLTWQEVKINHGNIFYEVSVQIQDDRNLATQTRKHWIEIPDVTAYTKMTVTLRAYSYWGYGPVTVSEIYSPMSVPSKPLTPRVYITQHKQSMTSENSLAADFRWTLPEHLNGVITEFVVYSWKSGDENNKNTTSVPKTARHFNLHCLKPSMTYFFQVSCCTQVGCGTKSDLVSAEADAVNPVPKLLVVTSSQLIVEEVDNVGNKTMILEPSVSPITATYLAQDNRMFWVNQNNVLMESDLQTQKKLLELTGHVSDMIIDWISRTLFIVRTNAMQTNSSITSYLLDQGISFTLLSRNGLINSVVSDPHTSTIVWTEMEIGGSHFILYKLGSDGEVTQLLSTSRKKRDTTNCNCTSLLQPGSVLTVDHSQDKRMEVMFYDEASHSIVATDINGCYCRPVVTGVNDKGLPPDMLTVDHSHIYWYNNAEKLLYIMDKQSGVLSHKPMTDIKDIIAYGTHLQPLPSTECLDPTAYKGQIGMAYNTDQSITLELQPIVWPSSCQGISHPDTKYTIYYKSGTEADSCGAGGSGCLSESSYNNTVTISNLQPYTVYVIHGAVSNYYTEYLSEALSQPVLYSTLVGVPSKAKIEEAAGFSPEEVQLTWSQPTISNGPMEDLVYVIRWSTQTDKGLYEGEHEYNVSSSRSPYQRIVSNLLPNHTYKFEVKTSNSEKKLFSISEPVTVKTYELPREIIHLSSSEQNLTVGWTSPSDGSAYYFKFQCQKCPYDSAVQSLEKLPMPTQINMTYNVTFDDLEPYTDYCFRMVIMYSRSNFVWKGKSGFIFRTLSSIPEIPIPPKVETLSSQAGYEVVWTEPSDNGAVISHYILQYWNDQNLCWYDIFNGTETRWIVDDGVIPPGKEYTFRVAAENANGLGPFSFNSTPFTFIELAQVSEDSVAIISITLSFLFVFLLVLLLAICYVIRRRNRKKRKPKQFMAMIRGPDTELAILRELPHTTVQQSNTLYAINIIPTDGDIAKLPHFRRDQLMLTKFLGSGAFGEVFEGSAKNIITDSSGETKVAVKTLRKSASDHEKEEFLKEAVLMSNFKHDHILSLLGVCLDNDPQFIILELMEGGDLLSYLRTSRGLSTNAASLCLTDLVKICVNVARGCKYLEEMHFVHRDLAARNCLVSSKTPSEMVVKIGDFGLARDIYKNDYYRKEGEGLLPVRWMSPESLVDGVFTTQSDIWAFGVLMWEVLTFGHQPYQARTNIEVLHFVRSGGQLEQPENCPEELYVLMSSCWSYGPEDRPTFSYILQQLELFHEKCVTLLADYIMPVRTRPIDVDGYLDNQRHHRNNSNNNNKTNQITTSSHGHDTSDHEIYRKVHRATSFDSPEPCDASLDMSSDYLHPQTNGTPTYLQLLQDPVVRKTSQSSVQSARKTSQSSIHSSVNEPVVRKTSQSSSHSSVNEPVVRKTSQSSTHSSVDEPVVRKTSQSSTHSSVDEPVFRKTSQSSTHSSVDEPVFRKTSQNSTHSSTHEPVVRKTSQSNSRHSSSSSDIYSHVQFSGYSIVSVPEEIPSYSGMSDEQRIINCQKALTCQQNYEDILLNYDHVPPTNQIELSQGSNPQLNLDSHHSQQCIQPHSDQNLSDFRGQPIDQSSTNQLNHNHDSSHVTSDSSQQSSSIHQNLNHDLHLHHNQNLQHHQHHDHHLEQNQNPHFHRNHNIMLSKTPVCVQMNADAITLTHSNNPNHVHHSVSDPQMEHIRQYCHSVTSNSDILLNYDHVPPQIKSSFYDPRLNYDYPNPLRECNNAEERLYCNNKENILPKVQDGSVKFNNTMINGSSKLMYKNLDFTDSMNYVDCNKNRGAHSSLSSNSNIQYGGNFSKAIQYWTTNNSPGNPVRGSKAQIYPVSGQDTLAATLV